MRRVLQGLFFIMVLACLVSAGGSASATDEVLMLNGVIKSIDYKSHLVVIDVRNKGCNGTKTFLIDDISKLKGAAGDEIVFYVDSPFCPPAKGSKMTPRGW